MCVTCAGCSTFTLSSLHGSCAHTHHVPPPLPAVRYVLVQADTLQVPTDSLLRAARRQLGEPSDSRGAPGFSAAAEGPPPTSVARSRPRHDALEAGTDRVGAEACLSLLSADAAECQAVVAQAEAAQQLQQVGASHQERRKGSAAAVGAQPAATCAAPAESDEETETDGETESGAGPSQADRCDSRGAKDGSSWNQRKSVVVLVGLIPKEWLLPCYHAVTKQSAAMTTWRSAAVRIARYAVPGGNTVV